MTQRDWQKDMEICERYAGVGEYANWTKMSMYWLQEAKKRGEREFRMQNVLYNIAMESNDERTRRQADHILSVLYPDTPAPTPEITARPIDEWHEEIGDVLWWMFPIQEPPYCGNPLDSDWLDCYTHWTPFECPAAPAPKEGE